MSKHFKKQLRTEYLMVTGFINTGNTPLKIEQIRIIQDPENPVFSLHENLNGFEVSPLS